VAFDKGREAPVMADKKFGEAITISWNTAPLPAVGECLVSKRSAYLVGYVRQRDARDREIRAEVRAMRIDPDTIPTGLKVTPFEWESRDPVQA
jgi:hypothetical protein